MANGMMTGAIVGGLIGAVSALLLAPKNRSRDEGGSG